MMYIPHLLNLFEFLMPSITFKICLEAIFYFYEYFWVFMLIKVLFIWAPICLVFIQAIRSIKLDKQLIKQARLVIE
jgi:hypothetical protein